MRKGSLAGLISMLVAMATVAAHGQLTQEQQAAEEAMRRAALSAARNAPARTDIPVDAFRGCDEPTTAPSGADAAKSNADRMRDHSRTPVADPITSRVFASFSLDEIEQGAGEAFADQCWFRLDGVWREQIEVTLDRRLDPPDWGSDTPELVSLANGNYTTPVYVVVEPSQDSNRMLIISSGLEPTAPTTYLSGDGSDLKVVLTRGGPAKTYRASEPSSLGRQLIVDVTRSGHVRMRIDQRMFMRPKPGVSKAASQSQVRSDDTFLLGYNLENLSAVRKGYDVTTQDPFLLLQNPKAEVFARSDPQSYFIDEKRTIPMGWTLVKEDSQGTVFSRSLMASEREIQQTVSSSYGANIGLGGTANVKNKQGPAELSAGFSYAKSLMNGMRNSATVSQAVGYARVKQFALVADHPYSKLSDGFIDAVEDARRYGKYDEIIARFGTHYPYAVTYGAAGKMTQSFSENSYAKFSAESSSETVEAGFKLFGVGGSAYSNSSRESSGKESSTASNERTTFVAAGGNGSWGEAGFSSGPTPYPILLDLRPLTELLNPINFPGEGEIYTSVRQQLSLRIGQYLEDRANQLSSDSLQPAIEAWVLQTEMFACDSAGTDDGGDIEMTGRIHLEAITTPTETVFKPITPFLVNIAQRRPKYIMCPGRWSFNDPGNRRELIGTPAQLRMYSFRVSLAMVEIDSPGGDDSVSGQWTFKLPVGKPIGHVERVGRPVPNTDNAKLGLHWFIQRIR